MNNGYKISSNLLLFVNNCQRNYSISSIIIKNKSIITNCKREYSIKRKDNKNNNDDNNKEVYIDKEYESYKIHKPVLINEVIKILDPKPNKVYIDATFGMGGHSRGILEHCKECYVIAFDRDPNVFEMTKSLRSEFKDRLITINSKFSSMKSSLKDNNLDHLKISGILYDFGVSSYQVDTADRGFSYKKDLDGPLDMRMNNKNSTQLSAADIVNTFSAQDLRDIFFYLGEEKHTKNIANEIIRKRSIEPIKTTNELVKIIECCIPYPAAAKTISRIFRSLRMYVNDELNEVKVGLSEGEKLLETDGKLLAISFHSLEDRIVKKFLNKCSSPPQSLDSIPLLPSFKFIDNENQSTPISPTDEELEWNPRSKSAILRTAIRTSNKPISDIIF